MKFKNSIVINSELIGTININSDTVLTVSEFKAYCSELQKLSNILKEEIISLLNKIDVNEEFTEEFTMKADGEMYVTPPK